MTKLPFKEVWAVDFEFTAHDGSRPHPICCVARELRSGRTERLWLDRDAPALPPYPTDKDTLFIAYYASAEVSCHMALGWPIPESILDLCAEFKRYTSGRSTPCGRTLLGALTYHGLPSIEAESKED